MEISKMEELFKGDNYEFLRNNKNLGDNIVLLTLGGSYAYGTNIESSDIDLRGIAKNSVNDLLGLSNFEQFTDTKTDTTIYSLNKIVKLLLNCNPNVIELLGTRDEHIFKITEEGQMLKDNIELFLSKKLINSFGGYATSQLRKIQNSLSIDKYPQIEKEGHILASIKKQVSHIKTHYKNYEDFGSINFYLNYSKKEGYEKEVCIDIDLKKYPVRDFKNIHSEVSNLIHSYDQLTHRNKKPTKDKLLKHTMHLIRLLSMGTEILEGKGVNTYREKERNLFLDIRKGKYDFDEMFEIINKYDNAFLYAKENTILPDKVNFSKVEELVINLNKKSL